MKFKAEWSNHLHSIRAREVSLIFRRCPDKVFEAALELGAGDGYQSRLLVRYVGRLVVTDIRWHTMEKLNARIEQRICDAESVEAYFHEGEFDLVYSSNLLEHLPNPGSALRGIFKVLKNDGITIHIMPSQFWKLCQLGLFYPDLALRLFEAGAQPDTLKRFLRRRILGKDPPPTRDLLWDPMNNPKMPAKPIGFWRQLLWPRPHGAYATNLHEFLAFRRSRWVGELSDAGFHVRKIFPGPVSSPYGFGLNRVRAGLERLGLATEYIFIATKHGSHSPYITYF